MKNVFIFLTISMLNAEQTDSPVIEFHSFRSKEIKSYKSEPTKTSFRYTAMGPRFGISRHIADYEATSGDISFGRRELGGHHIFDYNFGIGLQTYQYIYGQCSYLYYFKPPEGFYSGVGFTGGIIHLGVETAPLPRIFPIVNIPVTVGYQFSSKFDKQRFVQLQATPFLSFTLSYGFEF